MNRFQQQDPNRETEYESPWKHFSTLQKPAPKDLALAAVLYGVAAVAVPLGFFHDLLAYAFWAALLIGGFYLSRRMSLAAKLAVLASVVAALLPNYYLPTDAMGFYPAFGTLAAAMCVGVMAGTYFQTCTRLFWVPVLLTATAAGIAFLVAGHWLYALAAAALLPAVVLLSVATNRGEYCTAAICFATGGLLLSAAVAVALWVWKHEGTLSVDAFRSVLSGWQTQYIQLQTAGREEVLAPFREIKNAEDSTAQMISTADAMIRYAETMLSDASIRSDAVLRYGTLPAVICLFCAIPAYLSQRMLNGAYASSGMKSVLTPEAEFFTMSIPSAVLCVLSTLILVLAFSADDLVSIAAANLSFLLLPGFVVLGLRTLRTKLLDAGLRSRLLPVIVVAVLFCCLSSIAIYLLALYGAYDRIASAIRKKLDEKSEYGDSDDDL